MTTTICAYRGSQLGTYNLAGQVVTANRCEKLGTPCTDDANAAGLQLCGQACAYYVPNNDGPIPLSEADSHWVSCAQRGEPIGETVACGCNVDRDIYACSIHGKCFKRLPIGKARASFTQLDGVTICSDCADWKVDIPSEPPSETAT